ncbi:hypothetical protein CLOBOL_05904 [Enterocloster bolteae ATCC BAA-613]|jgi:hypothetical protein|uniref:Uncharacterized protein n=1 Tax=Enterocloster bolteae (strain ATCC BAA-613 / DSM 15670 / CCUG 46953 / JCM 12243 / WAL 16351) TaxID=411902 RepID=A8S1A5_ENTBW|nr:hypothetical protein CLOBOL_05904 [Enterocloster bolteae ATCC BAA-613]
MATLSWFPGLYGKIRKTQSGKGRKSIYYYNQARHDIIQITARENGRIITSPERFNYIITDRGHSHVIPDFKRDRISGRRADFIPH